MNELYNDTDDYDSKEGFGLIVWLLLLFISCVIFLISHFVIFSKKELDEKVDKKIEVLEKQNNPNAIPVEPVTEEEMEIFRKLNKL